MLLRTTNDVIETLRARKKALGLTNDALDTLAGTVRGHWDKCCGPARHKMPTLVSLMAWIGALGLAIELAEDPDTKVRSRWERRSEGQVSENGRISKVALQKARPLVLAELARKGGVSWWANKSPEERRAHIARLNAARAAKRQAGLNKAA